MTPLKKGSLIYIPQELLDKANDLTAVYPYGEMFTAVGRALEFAPLVQARKFPVNFNWIPPYFCVDMMDLDELTALEYPAYWPQAECCGPNISTGEPIDHDFGVPDYFNLRGYTEYKHIISDATCISDKNATSDVSVNDIYENFDPDAGEISSSGDHWLIIPRLVITPPSIFFTTLINKIQDEIDNIEELIVGYVCHVYTDYLISPQTPEEDVIRPTDPGYPANWNIKIVNYFAVHD